jgi:hypothetical protein
VAAVDGEAAMTGGGDDMLFALPVAIRRCRRNRSRIVIVSATGEVLLRTLDNGMREQDIIERFVVAMNEWAAADLTRLRPHRYGLTRLELEEE